MPQNRQIKDILKKHHLAPSKTRGQNFLINTQIAERIVAKAGITGEDTVLELGVGFGALTTPIAHVAKQVLGLELDAGIIKYHQEEKDLPSNVTVLHQDLLRADFKTLSGETGSRLKIMANLPYSITNPLLFKLIDCRDDVEWAVLMLQKEVGQRLTARVGTKEYGILTVLLGACASVEKLLDVGPGNFHPRPKVDSVVVKILFHPTPIRAKSLPMYDFKLFRALVNAAFQQRRKTLLNALAAGQRFTKQRFVEALLSVGISPTVRAERLTTEDFVRLTRELSQTT